MDKRKNCGVGMGAAKIGGLALSSLLGTTFLCGTAAPALAAADDHDMLDVSNLERVNDGSLDDLRGGFNVGGYEVSFGVVVTTSVNGQQLLQTSFNINQPGQIGNVVTQYIQQQQAAVGNGGSGGNGIGQIEVEVEIDEDGEIDIDVDSDIDFDADEAPEIAQAIDSLEAEMEGLENGGGGPAVAENQVALAPGASDDASSIGGGQPATDVSVGGAFQQGEMAPLAPAGGSAGSAPDVPENPQIDTSGIESAVAPGTAGAGGTPWTVSGTPDGSGVQISSADLATTIIQHIGNDISTSITNSADNMKIEHSTELNLYMENFAEMQSHAITSQVLGSMMFDITNQATNGN